MLSISCNFQSQYQQRRMSDPSQGLSTFVRGGLRKGQIRKSQSESDNMDANWMGYHEVEAEDLTDGRSLENISVNFIFISEYSVIMMI